MKGKSSFTESEASKIKNLLQKKVSAKQNEQKQIRKILREHYQFYISDFNNPENKSGAELFDYLLRQGMINLNSAASDSNCSLESTESSKISDECYVLNLCDQILGECSLRQCRFDFLRGHSGKNLPVDAYYEKIGLVIEYHEKQHSESVPFFDEKDTVSGVSRAEQRRLYDQIRRNILPQQGIKLIEISYSDLSHNDQKRLLRRVDSDVKAIREKLKQEGVKIGRG